MEVMALPSKETLLFIREIDPWIASESLHPDGVVLVFQKETPDTVMDLLRDIKKKIDFNIKSFSKM